MSIISDSSEDHTMNQIWVSPPPSDTPETIPTHVVDLLNTLDTNRVLNGVDMEDVDSVMSVVHRVKRDRIVSDLVRLQDLYRLLEPHFSPNFLDLVERQIERTSAELSRTDRDNLAQVTTMKKRTDVLNVAVEKGLLDEHRDAELFNDIIRLHARSFTPSTPI